jgi:hypothetical protein
LVVGHQKISWVEHTVEEVDFIIEGLALARAASACSTWPAALAATRWNCAAWIQGRRGG